MSNQPPITEKAAPVEREHRDGCMTEYTWDEDDCNCRPCPVCGGALRLGACRWAPHTRVLPPERTSATDE